MAISAIATILIGLARRIESSGVDYPNWSAARRDSPKVVAGAYTSGP